ncbi:hypothetical protein K1W69_00420 [Hoeflea sp. WL0058]|uniref:PRC-barrel domain-containing protein n=1 Tax=Flavimaribacter sediminis TaxID=2865987 RepID=A0AAE3CZ71_9HYPH|nr:hypothetical protein [Flavimaribacter sediminis]MBW8635633.1 hypothetical protein [Flavimaribacter sediminis]
MPHLKAMKALFIFAGVALTPAAALAADDEAHPANDSVLGLTVVSERGTPLGYVLDAPVDDQGVIETIEVAEFHTDETVQVTFSVDAKRVLRVDDLQVVIRPSDIESIPVARNRVTRTGAEG